MKCPECKHEIPEDSMFCNKCGCHLIKGTDGSKDTCVMDSERKLVTVMFSDMSGYTAMTERLDPEEVKGIMSQIFGKITEIIKKYDGFIERFIGDAVMAVFGVPKAHEDDPLRAIRAALEIHAAVKEFSPQFEQKIGCSLTMHTGINTGLVVTGEVDIEKGTHGLTGDAINLSSRLEGIAQSGEILVGESTYQLSKGYFNFESMDPTQLKGKAGPVPVYKMISALDQQVITKPLRGVQAELIGRDPEMDMLMEAINNLKHGQGSIVSILGHAGTGKSRLVREFKSRINRKRVQWREGHAYAYTQNMAYYPLTNLLTYAFQIREGDKPEQIKVKVETGVQELLWDKPEAIKYLGGLFSITYAEIDKVSPEFWHKQLHESVQQLLNALASRSPTVILFEDLHWADVSFIDLLHSLIENTHRPILLLCVYRPSFKLFSNVELAGLPWPHYTIELQDMSWEQTQAMLKSLLSSRNLPDELRYFVKQKVEGNPFYLEEVINSLIETDILTSEKGSWKVSQSLNFADIPPTIQGVLTARLDRLEKEAKRILQEASVIGRAFFYEVLNRVTELHTHLDECLLGLESLDLIRTRSKEPDLEYIFKHALTQEVVYNGLLKEERREIHERIGTVMELLFKNRLPEFYETLAHHFYKGKSVIKAVDYLAKSGEKCFRRFSLDEAHQYFMSAFESIKKIKNRLDPENKVLLDLLTRWAPVFYYRGDFIGLDNLLSSQEETADKINDKEIAALFFAWKGFTSWWLDKFDNCNDYLEKSLKLCETNGSLKAKGYALAWIAWLYAETGLFQKCIETGMEANKLAIELNDTYLYFKSLGAVSRCHWYLGNGKECLKIGKNLIEHGTKVSHTRCMVMGYWNIAQGYMALGDFDSAIKASENAYSIAKDPFFTEASLTYLIFSSVLNNDMSIARKHIESSNNYFLECGNKHTEMLLQLINGILLIDEGNLSRGWSVLIKCNSYPKKSGRTTFHYISEHIMGKIFLTIVQGDAPVKLLLMIKNIGFVIKKASFAFRHAENHFTNTIKLAEKAGAIGYTGQVHLDLGLLYKAKKKPALAQKHFEKAISIFEQLGAEAFLKEAQKNLVSLK
jgi:class 3 adenylate cyclase/tetratricopeptide (TPR) repeat protein